MSAALSRSEIAEAVRRLGIGRGDHVYLHSSLSKMGYIEGGAAAVVEAFLDVLGNDGTLMVPTFTFSATETFDVVNSPSKTGAITEAVRTHPRAVRSWHPTHSSAAIGRLADWLVADHLLYGALDVGCPEDRLARLGGWVLLLGVDQRSNSTVHVGEAYAGAAARRVRYNALRPARPKVITPDGDVLEVFITSMPGCSAGFNALETPLRTAGLMKYGKIGDAPCRLARGRGVIDQTVALLRQNPDALACDRLDCPISGPARAFNEAHRARRETRREQLARGDRALR